MCLSCIVCTISPSDRLREILPFRRRRYHEELLGSVRTLGPVRGPRESLGIVGPDGSGKSTLLQVAAGILQPTSGRVSTEGRVAALLELGAGFDPEFSGRENVFLNSEIIGLSPLFAADARFLRLRRSRKSVTSLTVPSRSTRRVCMCGLLSPPPFTLTPKS